MKRYIHILVHCDDKNPRPGLRHKAHGIEWDAPVDPEHTTQKNLDMMPERHRSILEKAPQNQTIVATGYKRTRHGKQVLEVRFDGIAGCLRTPEGGSSRQLVILKRDGQISTRLLTVREAARLMGAPDSFVIPGGYNEGYKAMGDARRGVSGGQWPGRPC